MKYFMKKIEKMLKSENDDVALQNRILAVLRLKNSNYGEKNRTIFLSEKLI